MSFSNVSRRGFLQAGAVSLADAALPPALAADKPAGKDKAASSGALKLLPRFGDGRDWWFEKRFGMFVHWGLYSIEGWHEQDQWRRRIPRAEYEKLAHRWNPVKFDPDRWLDIADSAGMQYICLTTKRHDGFCLFETKQATYNTLPRKATLLNDGRALECSIDVVPTEHVEQGRFLRVRKIPVNELANSVPVLKLEFDTLPDAADGADAGRDDIKVR